MLRCTCSLTLVSGVAHNAVYAVIRREFPLHSYTTILTDLSPVLRQLNGLHKRTVCAGAVNRHRTTSEKLLHSAQLPTKAL
jgi:hypothetical protein